MSWLYIALLAIAVVLLAGAEWPRLEKRQRDRRKQRFRVVRDDEADDFAASVERDLKNLPTIDDRERR